MTIITFFATTREGRDEKIKRLRVHQLNGSTTVKRKNSLVNEQNVSYVLRRERERRGNGVDILVLIFVGRRRIKKKKEKRKMPKRKEREEENEPLKTSFFNGRGVKRRRENSKDALSRALVTATFSFLHKKMCALLQAPILSSVELRDLNFWRAGRCLATRWQHIHAAQPPQRVESRLSCHFVPEK